jgi:hypothetical protein
MSCENCEIKEEKMPASVPYMVYETAQARNERDKKRLLIALVVSVVLIFISNAIWLWAWMQYDYTSEEIIVDSNDGGNANYIGQNGDINNYGEGDSPSENSETQEQ